MPTAQENLDTEQLNNALNRKNPVKKLGILAGGGDIPEHLASCCERNGIEVFVVAFDGQTGHGVTRGREHVWVGLGSVGKVIKTLKNHNVANLVMIGHIRRPLFTELKPDLKGAELIARIGLRSLGDNDILEVLRDELQREGFTVHGVQDFVGDLLTKQGVLGRYKPARKHEASIRRGVEVALALGAMDVGQSVVVQDDLVIAVEGIEGTDELMRRSKGYFRKGAGGILVKTCKPHQDKYLDLPTVGPDTVRIAAESGFCGIAIEAGNSLMVDPDAMAKQADQHKIFVYGFSISDYKTL